MTKLQVKPWWEMKPLLQLAAERLEQIGLMSNKYQWEIDPYSSNPDKSKSRWLPPESRSKN